MGDSRPIILLFTGLLVVGAFTIFLYQVMASSGWRRPSWRRSYSFVSMEITTTQVWTPRPLHTAVVFLKTHKTASSTFQNIMYRFGEKHNMTFAFPTRSRFNQFSYPKLFNHTFVAQHLKGNHVRYDILCNHMRFHAKEVASIVQPNAVYLSIVRQPEKTFESGFYYYQNYVAAFGAATKQSKGKDPLRTFLENPQKFAQIRQPTPYVRNPIAFDFGFDSNANVSSHTFLAQVERVDAMFHLVMIAERFDESVILAKNLLGWDMDDIVYLSLNKRQTATKIVNSTLQEIEPTLSELIRRWNALDVFLYTHFYNRFQRHVDAFGKERMRREVDALNKMCRTWREMCVQDEVEGRKINDTMLKPYIPWQVKILGYRMKDGLDPNTRQQCLRLLMPELKFHELLFNKQQKRNES